ncbi:thioredoxin family protein [Arenicella chitinivorans]|uniref:Thioredoxin family protein n=2 Tax=Arenicella chitinivorans TaxID=1329800 RepID=A0A918RNZ1_9GAMM|nr:thioredoxin family protein [Arenicella chitinivorans]
MRYVYMNRFSNVISVFLVLVFASPVFAAPEVGKPAPEFAMQDTEGNDVSLTELRGKTVVLEWFNDGCPYVRKHYGSNNMQALQNEAVADGVVWVTVISSAPGKQGYVTAEEGNALTAKHGASPTHLLLDPEGTLGKAYDARTTPHMYIIDPKGELVYMGGIDDKPTANPADIDGANNYVRSALAELKSGTSITSPTTRPYGCSVKYSS